MKNLSRLWIFGAILVSSINASAQTDSIYQFEATGNPVITHKYTADPAAFVYNDVFYVYAGQDTGDGK